MQQGQMQEDQIAKRLQMLLGAGTGETGRQDMWDQLAYGQYAQDKWAPLDHLAPFVTGTPMGQAEPIVTSTGGEAGGMEFIAAMAPIIAAMVSDENQKENIQETGYELLPGVPIKTWDWKFNKQPGIGVIAQELEKVMPEAVFEVPAGTKLIDTARLVSGLQLGA